MLKKNWFSTSLSGTAALCFGLPSQATEEEEAPPQGVKGNRGGGHVLVPSSITPLGKDHGTAKQRWGGVGRAGTKEPLSGQRDGLCQDQSQSLGFWKGCRGKSQEPHITPERKSHPVDERATWLHGVTGDSLHVHAER